MADPVVIAVQTVQARDELAAECRKLAESLGIDPPAEPPLVSRDPEFKTLQQTRAQVEFLRRANEAYAEPPPTAPPRPAAKASVKPAAAPAPAAPKK